MSVNPYLVNLQSNLRQRFSVDAQNMSMSEWVCKNTLLNREPFSLDGYEFQRAILDDLHPDMVVKKISQVGITELQIRKALAFARRNPGVNIIFSLATTDMFRRVSVTRIRPIVDNNPVFATAGTRSQDLIQLDESFVFIVPAVEASATSIDADVVMIDERDLSNQEIVALYNSRLENSDIAIRQEFSTPTYPGFGIDLQFQSTDQMHFMCRCQKCGQWNHPEFDLDHVIIPGLPDKVDNLIFGLNDAVVSKLDLSKAYVGCRKCHAPLDLGSVKDRCWVPKYPDKQRRGYMIGPFSTVRRPLIRLIGSLLRYQREEKIHRFINTGLGQAYASADQRLTRQQIMACMTGDVKPPEIPKGEKVFLGSDMGQTCHLVLARGATVETAQPFLFEAVHIDNLKKRIGELDEEYNIVAGGLDRHPYEPTSQEISLMTNRRILPIEYSPKLTQDVRLVKDNFDQLDYVQINRTRAIDQVVRRIRMQTLQMSGYYDMKETIIDHLMDMVRVENEEKQAIWQKLGGKDHFFHALVYLLAAYQIRQVVIEQSGAEIRSVVAISTPKIKAYSSGLPGFSGGLRRKRLERRLM